MILSLNPGSSSIKYKLFSKDLSQICGGDFQIENQAKSPSEAVYKIFDSLKLIGRPDKIVIRIVHGGDKFIKPQLLDKKSLKEIHRFSYLAPLHNLPALKAVGLVKKYFKNIPLYGVFDTSFFASLPEEAITYALPYEVNKKMVIRRYGFHGISHEYVACEVDSGKKLKVISIHLGSGCSMAAIKEGKPVAASMGMTPDQGLIMQTRSGDLDPGVIFILIKKYGLSKAKEMIEKKSGLLGLVGVSGNMWDVLNLAGEKVVHADCFKFIKGDEATRDRAKLALKIYVSKIREYIGAYTALMEGVDVIAFSGKIGFLSPVIRERVLDNLEFLGYQKVEAVAPNEELEMARKVINLEKRE